jgi:hypothetical protein
MADNLPVNFPIPGESTISSYNWNDIASGLGYVNFYLCSGSNSTDTTNYFLTEQTLVSEKIEADIACDTPAAEYSLTFMSSSFNAPRYVKGVASIPLCYFPTVSQAGTSLHLEVVIEHYDGSLATTLATFTGSNITTTNNNIVYKKQITLTLTPKLFRIGDFLRVKIIIDKTASGGAGTDHVYFGIDPLNRDGTHFTSINNEWTNSKSMIPFKIEL